MNGDFISVGEALKVVPLFKGDKREFLVFIGNVETAFAVINRSQEVILYKFLLMRISGEPRTVISDRNLESWAELKEFLQNTYIKNMRVSCLRLGKGRTKRWRTGSTKFRIWCRSFVKPHCSIAEKGRERAYWIFPTGYATFALFRN